MVPWLRHDDTKVVGRTIESHNTAFRSSRDCHDC